MKFFLSLVFFIQIDEIAKKYKQIIQKDPLEIFTVGRACTEEHDVDGHFISRTEKSLDLCERFNLLHHNGMVI